MSSVSNTISKYGWRRIAFTVVVLVGLAIWAILAQGWRNLIFLVSTWVGGIGFFPEDFFVLEHRLHEFAFALVLFPWLFGMLAQFRSPTKHITGMWMALLVFAALLVAFGLTNFWDPVMIVAFLGVPTALATILHPSGLELIRSFDVASINWVLLALVVVAAIPLVAYAGTQIGLQTGAIEQGHTGGGDHAEIHEQHIEFGHFTLTTAFVFAVIITGLLASFQQPGWWLAAWVTGLMVLIFAVGGLLTPEAASNPGQLWDVAAAVWAVVFIGAAEMTQTRDAPTFFGARSGA